MDKQEKQDKQEILAQIYLRNLDTVYQVCWLYIVDYTDVEAIIFCGKEFSITEKDF